MNFIVQIRPVNPQKGICERRTRVAQQIFNTLRGDKIHVLLVCLSKRRKLSQKCHQSSCFSHHHHRSRLLNALIFPEFYCSSSSSRSTGSSCPVRHSCYYAAVVCLLDYPLSICLSICQPALFVASHKSSNISASKNDDG